MGEICKYKAEQGLNSCLSILVNNFATIYVNPHVSVDVDRPTVKMGSG